MSMDIDPESRRIILDALEASKQDQEAADAALARRLQADERRHSAPRRAPPSPDERIASLEAENQRLRVALAASEARAAASDARATEAVRCAAWLEAGKADFKARLRDEVAAADVLRRRVDEAQENARLRARRERELRGNAQREQRERELLREQREREGRAATATESVDRRHDQIEAVDPFDGTREVDAATGLAADAPEFSPVAVSPDSRPEAPTAAEAAILARATRDKLDHHYAKQNTSADDPDFASELARARANCARAEATKQQKSTIGLGIDPSHYKTRLCVYLGGNGCPHGDRCGFAHSQEELRAPAASTVAEFKTRPCRYSLAECPFAAAGRCQFAHSLDELRPGPLSPAGKNARRFKTKLCKYFLAGLCPYVATCVDSVVSMAWGPEI